MEVRRVIGELSSSARTIVADLREMQGTAVDRGDQTVLAAFDLQVELQRANQRVISGKGATQSAAGQEIERIIGELATFTNGGSAADKRRVAYIDKQVGQLIEVQRSHSLFPYHSAAQILRR